MENKGITAKIVILAFNEGIAMLLTTKRQALNISFPQRKRWYNFNLKIASYFKNYCYKSH